MMPRAHKITRRTLPSPPAPAVPAASVDRLLGDLRALIEAAREQAARSVNSALVGLYWHIGKRIREDVLQEKRAEYGEAIVSTVSKQLSWNHFVEILKTVPLLRGISRAVPRTRGHRT